MLLAVFQEINFITFARKYGVRKLTKMTLILINTMSKKKNILKKQIKNAKNVKTEIS